jgi:hypothetical protein
MRNAIVWSFKGYDTTKHRYILRPAKATLERIRRIDKLDDPEMPPRSRETASFDTKLTRPPSPRPSPINDLLTIGT